MSSKLTDATILIAGCGNIGSPLASLLARAGVERLRLVDRDRVEPRNLITQDFAPEDVGRFKAEVLAERLRQRFPTLTVEARTADLEDLPLGDFQVNVVLGALDSRRARQALASEIAWPLGVPVVDGGVGEGLRGRVQVFHPGPDRACLECGWSKEDYRHLAAEYPCLPGAAAEAPPTAAPAFIGTVVAGIMAAEAVRLLAGPAEEHNCEIAFDLCHRRFLVSRLRRNPYCRFDHQVVHDLLPLGVEFEAATVADLLAVVSRSIESLPAHLECRRNLLDLGAFDTGRLLAVDALRRRAGEPLAALGLMPSDRVRVRTEGRGVLVALDQALPATPTGKGSDDGGR